MNRVPAVVKLESFVGEVCWQGDDISQEEDKEEDSEEIVWCQIVPANPVNLSY